MQKRSVGRPRKYSEYVWFGMKISLEDREVIRRVSRKQGTSASETVMSLIKNADQGTKSSKITASDIGKMPLKQRSEYLKKVAMSAAVFYQDNAEEIWDVNEDIIE